MAIHYTKAYRHSENMKLIREVASTVGNAAVTLILLGFIVMVLLSFFAI